MQARHIILIIVIIVLVLVIWYNREKWKNKFRVEGARKVLVNDTKFCVMLSAYLWYDPILNMSGLKVGALSNRCNMFDEYFNHILMSETSENNENKHVLQLLRQTSPPSITPGIPTLNYSCLQNNSNSTTTFLDVNMNSMKSQNYKFLKNTSTEYYYNTWLIADMDSSIYKTKTINKMSIINDDKINNKLIKQYGLNKLNTQCSKILEFKILCEFLTLIEGIIHQYLTNDFSDLYGINKDDQSYLDSVASEKNMANKDKFRDLTTENSIVALTFDREFYTFSNPNNTLNIFKIVNQKIDDAITNCDPLEVISVYNIDGNSGLYDKISTKKFNSYLTDRLKKITTRVNF